MEQLQLKKCKIPFGVRRRTWAEIDLGIAQMNFHRIRSILGERVKLCCVVKANAYGHGAIQLSALYQELGADYLAVSNIEEALQLRENGISMPILILGYTPEECVPVLVKQGITQCVYSYEYGKALEFVATQLGVRLKIHVKLDTGMGRIGFLCRNEQDHELASVAELCHSEAFFAEGIFTHFATADDPMNGSEYVQQQKNAFQYAIEWLKEKGITFSIRHCSNSAASISHIDSEFDMVRVGILLYGLPPSEQLSEFIELAPVMTLKSVICHIKQVEAGESISYGRNFVAQRPMRVATVPIGYGDGLWRSSGRNDGFVLIHGKKAPILGNICMDQMMVNVDEIDCKIGDEVTVFGSDPRCTASVLAQRSGTISYEIVCAVDSRVPRAYVADGEIKCWYDAIYQNDLIE